MKLSKFVKRAKSESYCVVIHADDSGIWLGTRLALYNATELPYMEGKEQAGAVLDIDSKAWEKMFFDEKYTAHAGADFGMNLTETDPTEQEARRVPLEMFYKGMGLVGLMYGNGGELIFYDAALIAPIADVVKTSDYICIKSRLILSCLQTRAANSRTPMNLSGCSMLGWTSTAYPRLRLYFIPTRTETG